MKSIRIAALGLSALSVVAADQATFRAQEIDNKIEIGYGLAIADVDGDKKTDILLADKKQFVWYKNPEWTKHILAENLTPQDNVCIAAQDIDGDGKAEVAVGAGWNPSDTVNSGALFYLVAPSDRTQKWEPVKLHHEPTIHRIRWVKGADGKYGLVSVPLHGRGNKNGEGAGVKIEFYHVPKDVKSEWKRTLISEDMHMTHNFEVNRWEDAAGDKIIVAGKEGINGYGPTGSGWEKKPFVAAGEQGFAGGGEVRGIRLSRNTGCIATIEPMHGTQVVVYTGDGGTKMVRKVIDESLLDGHAIAVADFLKIGREQFVAGWRGRIGAPIGSSSIGVKMFVPDAEGKNWKQQMIDDKGMACEDLAVGDLNGDGKVDLIAAGRGTKNVKIYWNETK